MRAFGLRIIFAVIAASSINLLTMGSAAAADAVVSEIRHWSNPDYTRIAITVNKKSKYTYRLLQKDPSINKPFRRLFVDIENAKVGKNLNKDIPINDGLLKKARAGQYKKNVTRVVLDIESIEEYKIYPMHADGGYEIVIDVSGERKAAKPAALRQPLPKPAPDKPQPSLEATPAKPPAGQTQRAVKIVIDAGHGGKDPGAVGKKGLREKDVALNIVRMVRERLSAKFNGKIILTRDRDVFIPLVERTGIANKEDADIFISIHLNASPKRAANGVETYILSLAKSEEARRLAARENSTSAESVGDLEFILNDLLKTAKTNDSGRLAEIVQKNLVSKIRIKNSKIRSNGIKGAPFYVLVGTRMPSILVEVSFISNLEEEKRLRDPKYLSDIVDGITSGIIEYMKSAGSV